MISEAPGTKGWDESISLDSGGDCVYLCEKRPQKKGSVVVWGKRATARGDGEASRVQPSWLFTGRSSAFADLG